MVGCVRGCCFSNCNLVVVKVPNLFPDCVDIGHVSVGVSFWGGWPGSGHVAIWVGAFESREVFFEVEFILGVSKGDYGKCFELF